MILYSATPDATEPDEGSAVMEVRNMILERKGETGLVTDDQIRSFVRRANRKTWSKAITINPRPWETRSDPVVYDQAQGYVELDALTIGDVGELADFAVNLGGATVSLLRYLEISYLGGWFPVFEGDNQERWTTEPGAPLSYPAPLVPAWYYIEGNRLYFSRPPGTSITFRCVFVPAMPDPADNEQMLYGRFPQHHDLISTEAARLCFARDERGQTPWDKERDELLATFVMALGRGQGNRGRRVGARSPFTP